MGSMFFDPCPNKGQQPAKAKTLCSITVQWEFKIEWNRLLLFHVGPKTIWAPNWESFKAHNMFKFRVGHQIKSWFDFIVFWGGRWFDLFHFPGGDLIWFMGWFDSMAWFESNQISPWGIPGTMTIIRGSSGFNIVLRKWFRVVLRKCKLSLCCS